MPLMGARPSKPEFHEDPLSSPARPRWSRLLGVLVRFTRALPEALSFAMMQCEIAAKYDSLDAEARELFAHAQLDVRIAAEDFKAILKRR